MGVLHLFFSLHHSPVVLSGEAEIAPINQRSHNKQRKSDVGAGPRDPKPSPDVQKRHTFHTFCQFCTLRKEISRYFCSQALSSHLFLYYLRHSKSFLLLFGVFFGVDS